MARGNVSEDWVFLQWLNQKNLSHPPGHTDAQPLTGSLGPRGLAVAGHWVSSPYETSRSSILPPTPRSMNTTTRARSVICAPAQSHSEVIQSKQARHAEVSEALRHQQVPVMFQTTSNFSRHKAPLCSNPMDRILSNFCKHYINTNKVLCPNTEILRTPCTPV